jgi:hypothetical protein
MFTDVQDSLLCISQWPCPSFQRKAYVTRKRNETDEILKDTRLLADDKVRRWLRVKAVRRTRELVDEVDETRGKVPAVY